MKKLFLIISALVVTHFTIAQTIWETDSSQIAFFIENAGFEVEGSFEGISTDISFSPNRIGKSRITASVLSNSVNTGIKIRDKHLQKYDYFDVTNFPKIILTSTSFREVNGNFIGDFELSLKGKKGIIEVPFDFIQEKKSATIKGDFTINRLDYGIGEESVILSDSVRVSIWVSLMKK